MVAAAVLWNKVAGARSPPRRSSGGFCRRVSGPCLTGDALAGWASLKSELLSSQLLPRVAIGGSVGGGKLVEEGGGGSGRPGPRRPAVGVQAPRLLEADL